MGTIKITSNLPCTEDNPAVLGQTIRLFYPEMAKEFHLTTIPNVPYMPVYGGENRIEANFTVNPYVTRMTRVDARVVGHTGNEGTWTGWMAPSSPNQSDPPNQPDVPDPGEEYGDVVFSSVVGPVVRQYLITVCEKAVRNGNATREGISNGRRQYLSNIPLAEWDQLYGDVVEPPEPPDPEPEPEPEPEPVKGTKIRRPVQTLMGWDTGVMVMGGDTASEVTLHFYKADADDPSKDGELVKSIHLSLGVDSCVKKMILSDWHVGECDIVKLLSEQSVSMVIGWVSPPYKNDAGEVVRSYTLMGD